MCRDGGDALRLFAPWGRGRSRDQLPERSPARRGCARTLDVGQREADRRSANWRLTRPRSLAQRRASPRIGQAGGMMFDVLFADVLVADQEESMSWNERLFARVDDIDPNED